MISENNVVEQRTFESIRYYRISDDTPSHPRGTVIFPDAVDQSGHIFTVWGFPRIKRVYVLERGLRRFFKERPFFLEEKLDGYNVRLVWVNRRVLALTRGGFVCPYTTEWAQIWAESMGLVEFFQDHPDHVLCGEALGDSPYNPQRPLDLPPGLHFFLFEISLPDGHRVPPEQKYELAARYAIPTVPQLGKFTVQELPAIKELLLEINNRGGEGIVAKGEQGERMVKYVTAASDLEDIRDHLPILFDLDSGYFTNRLLRTTLFVQELGLDEEEYAQRIGRAMLEGWSVLRNYRESAEEYRILVRNINTWKALQELLGTRVQVEELYTRPVVVHGRPFVMVGFKRVFRKSTKRFRMILKGYGHYD
ncbi:MAG: RNA ligase [Chloroflexi bacterium]|nr:RNA ligase [Chloroflexota bacterium]